jgi:hypothetical protein
MFVGVVSTGIVQAVAIAVPILRDRRADPIIHRWVAYTNLWCAVMFMPGGLIVFFKHGPFGWNGLVSWWMLLTAYWIWTIVNSYAMLRYAIPHQAREEDNADPELLTATTVPEAALPPPGWGSPSPSTP